MKYRVITLILAIAALSITGCKKGNTFEIEGTLTNGADKTIYIEELSPDGPQFLDSIKVDKHGHYSYSGKYTYQTFYNLHTTPYDYVVLVPYKGEKITVDGCFDSLSRSYKVSGSKESISLWQLQEYSNYGSYKLRNIVAMDQANREKYANDEAGYKEAKKETDSLYREAYDEQSMYVIQYLTDNAGSLSTLIALYKPFNGEHPLIDVDRFPELFTYYEQVLEGLENNPETSDNPHTIAFKNVVERVRFQVERNTPQAVNFTFNGGSSEE